MTREEFEQTLEAINNTIEQEKFRKKVGEAYARLKENDDFKLLFEGRYFEDEADRIYGFLTSDSNMRPEVRSSMIDKMNAIHHVKRFFNHVEREGNEAEGQIELQESYKVQVGEQYRNQDNAIDVSEADDE